MAVSSTAAPEFESPEAQYIERKLRALTPEQERTLYAYAVHAQTCLRLELNWVGDRMQIQLISRDEKRRV